MADTLVDDEQNYLGGNIGDNAVHIIEENDVDLFDGEYDEYHERSFYAEREILENYVAPESIKSKVENKRKTFIRMLITRPKRDFESNYQFVDKGPGEENSGDIKNSIKNDFITNDRAYLEIGLQTANKSNTREYQVPKKRTKNVVTQVEPGMADIKDIIEQKRNFYLKNQNKLNDLENFLNSIRSMMEQALQSNETIDIFQNDFDLDRMAMIKADDDKKDKEKLELRSFRDASAGQKMKKEKRVNYIRFVSKNRMYMGHSLIRNMTFDERIRNIGIPYPAQILFWDLKNPEASSPFYSLDLPMEITCFEFCPTNPNRLVCGMISGQLIFYDFKDLLSILDSFADTEGVTSKKYLPKDHYTFYITSVPVSHKTIVVDLKWFPPNLTFYKLNLTKSNSQESTILASLGEEGTVILWENIDTSIKNDTNNYIKPIFTTEVHKVDAFASVNGTCLCLRVDDKTNLLYVATEEGQVYSVDWNIRLTQDNFTANVKKVYNSKYYRPIICFQFSPFQFTPAIFLTLHDYYFCLWTVDRAKPIFISPSLKKSLYTFAKFSPTRPSVIFLTRNNGSVDIWDFLDESHKPSDKETIKEHITYFEIFKYYPDTKSEDNQIQQAIEYLAIGDYSGQITLMEVLRLFSEEVPEEKQRMQNLLENLIKRAEYMDTRFRSLDDELNKTDTNDVTEVHEYRDDQFEEEFSSEKLKILIELGLASAEETKTFDKQV